MTVLGRAELLLQADNYSGSGAWLDESGNGHNAQFGSTAGPDANDPRFLSYEGIKYLRVPGIAANYASTPSAAPLNITGDIDVQVRLSKDDWTPATNMGLACKLTAAGGQRSWKFALNTNGTLQFQWSTDGGLPLVTINSTVAPVVADGAILWVRATLDVNNGAGGNDVTFYTGGSGATPTWVQLGTTVTTAGVTSIFASSAILEIASGGNVGTLQIATGNFYECRVYNGIAGTLVFHADFNAASVVEPYLTFTESSVNAATVTINRAGTGRKTVIVDRPMFTLGTDDYFEVANAAGLNFTGAQSMTVMILARTQNATAPANTALVAKKDNLTTAAGYALFRLSGAATFRYQIADGTVNPEDIAAALNIGVLYTATGVRNVADDDIEAFKDGVGSGSPTTDSTTATLTNALPLRIGATSGTAGSFLDGLVMAVALWREALSDADIATADAALRLGIPEPPDVVGSRHVIRSPRYGITRRTTR